MITNTPVRWPFVPNGVTTAFNYDSLVLNANDLVLYWYDQNGNALLLPGYSVTGVGNQTGGQFIFNSPPAAVAGSQAWAERQTATLTTGNKPQDFLQESAAERERRNDQVLALAQESVARIKRSLSRHPMEVGADFVLPAPAVRGGKIFAFDLAGNPNLLTPPVGIPGDASTQTVLASGSVTARSLAARFGEVFNVRDYGAVGDGAADDAAAINAAVTAASAAGGGVVVFGRGVFNVSATINVPSNVWLLGSGIGITTVRATSANLPIFLLGAASYVRIEHMLLDRTIPATAGGHGISAPGITGVCRFVNLWVRNQYVGVLLGSTSDGDVAHVTVEQCYADGIKMANAAGLGQLQWRLFDVLSQKNDGYGYNVVSVAGPTQVSMGTWAECYTFANKIVGAVFTGLPGVPIQGIRFTGCFMGEDGGDIVNLNTYGTNHQFEGCYFELAGRAACGRNLATPQTNVGYGMNIGPNEGVVIVNGTVVNGHSYSGIKSQATKLVTTAVVATNNGLSNTAGERVGIMVFAGSANISGGTAGNTGGLTAQQYGVGTNVDGIVVNGVDLRNNVTAGLFNSATLRTSIVVGCLPANLYGFCLQVPAASLPLVTAADKGLLYFATDCRNSGEGAGLGTGCLVFVNSTGSWRAVWSGLSPTV